MSPTSIFDWTIYRHMFDTRAMSQIFNESGTAEAWVEVEKVVARTQGKLGIIPEDAASAICAQISAAQLDLEQLHEDTVDVGRPIVGLAKQLAEQVEDAHAMWVHYGITTYDIMDTGKVLQFRDGLNEIRRQLMAYRQALMNLAREHRDTVMIGRTNNMHAQPQTFGGKIAVWIEELLRHEERLDAVRQRIQVVQFGGAVGTLASLSPDGLKFRESIAEALGLGATLSNWHNARDSVTEMSLCLGNICTTLARIAQNLNSLGSTEIGEISETGGAGRGRSSAMAHKRNPRAAEFAESVARLGRQRAMGMVEVAGQEHDRCGGTWIAEWMLVPETFLLTAGALQWALDLVQRLDVHVDRMRANIDLMNGLALTERFTLELAKRMSKFEARAILDKACADCRVTSLPLADVLKDMPEVLNVLSAEEVDAIAEPETYTGAAAEIVDNVLAAAAAHDAAG